MRFYARPEYAHLRWRSLPINVLMLVCAVPIYLALGVGVVDALKALAHDATEVYGAFR